MKNFEKEPGHPRRTERQYRRRKRIEKANRRLFIIQLHNYAPHRGYVDWGFEGKTLLHTDKYIKYPKNSKCQRWLKRAQTGEQQKSANLSISAEKGERLSQGL